MTSHPQPILSGARAFAERRDILWIGGEPPRLLQSACGVEFRLVPVGPRPIAVGVAGPTARALLIEGPQRESDDVPWALPVIAEALTHGLGVALVQYAEKPLRPHVAEEQAYSDHFYSALRVLRARYSMDRLPGFRPDWHGVVSWVRDLTPTPGANLDLELTGAVPETLAQQLLLRRAFHDLSGVTMELLSGGKSGAAVWVVRPGQLDRKRVTRPFVVKIHSREKMEAERSNCSIVQNAVDDHLHARLDEARCVEGDDLALVTYAFVDRAPNLRQAIANAPAMLIASLFEQTLRGFLSRAHPGMRPLGRLLSERPPKVLRWSDDLLRAAKVAQQRLPSLPSPEKLKSMIAGIPECSVQLATVHGDLHAGNLFVRASSYDVIMIDYGSVTSEAPLVLDPACLEVSLAFPQGDPEAVIRAGTPAEHCLRTLYRFPLQAVGVQWTSTPSARELEWLVQAVRAIRMQALALEPDPQVYGLVLGGFLLRYASFGDQASIADRALAYECGCQLVLSVICPEDGRGDGPEDLA